MVKLSSYPKMKLNENDPHEDKIITEINLYPQIEDETSQFELLQNLALLKNPQQKDMLDALIHSTYGFFKIIDRDDIKALTILENVFTNEVITLTDMNLGSFNQLKQSYLYTIWIMYGIWSKRKS